MKKLFFALLLLSSNCVFSKQLFNLEFKGFSKEISKSIEFENGIENVSFEYDNLLFKIDFSSEENDIVIRFDIIRKNEDGDTELILSPKFVTSPNVINQLETTINENDVYLKCSMSDDLSA